MCMEIERWMVSEVMNESPDIRANKQVERTATKRCGFHGHWRHDTVVAVASALPVAVAHLGR